MIADRTAAVPLLIVDDLGCASSCTPPLRTCSNLS